MELMYTVCRKQHPSHKIQQNVEWLHEGISTCSISSRSAVAFVTTTELTDLQGKTWSSHVYVADLNTPWDTHKILSNPVPVSTIEWHVTGSKLLLTDIEGKLQMWSMKEYILNDWTCLGTACFPGEHILCTAFFHMGKKISLMSDKKDSILYNEKFSHLRFAPSVRSFGGRPLEGCVVVSSTGLVGVMVIRPDGQVLTTNESLGTVRHRIKVTDICYAKNGDFLVAASSGNVSFPIQCYRVTIRMAEDQCVINVQPLPSFFLQCCSATDSSYCHVTTVRFVVKEDADALIVAACGSGGSVMEMWELKEKHIQINKLFQQSQSMEPVKTVLWQHHAQFKAASPVLKVTTPRSSITSTSPPLCYVMVAFSDGTIQCLYRNSLTQVCSVNVNTALYRRDEPLVKAARTCVTISYMEFTCIGNALLVMDNLGQMYLYKVSPVIDPGSPMTIISAITLLEFCMVTGQDWWDVLLSLHPSMIEVICERLTESFHQQVPGLQQYYYTRFMSIKTSLYRMLHSGQNKAGDYNSLLMLYSVGAAFKSLLRPSDLSNQDQGPSEKLAVIMSSKNMESVVDIDNVLIHLEAKEFTVEASTLQSLQQLIQWTANLALYLLASLPEQRHLKAPGYELLRDQKSLSTLRELLVIIRIWGLIRQSCLPVFTKTVENLDVLALLFKLLSRLLQNSEPDEALIDECCLLPSQVMIPPMNLSIPSHGVASPALFADSFPLQFEYGQEAELLQFSPEPSLIEGAMQTDQLIDSVRHTFMGIRPHTIKQCSRCCGVMIAKTQPRTAATKAWEQRWLRSCPCGGSWRLKHLSAMGAMG